MWQRRNRNLRWGADAIKEPEKLVGFRIPQTTYQALKALALERRKPMAVLINEAIEAHFKLSKKPEKPAKPKREVKKKK